jgi:hypothetical protein
MAEIRTYLQEIGEEAVTPRIRRRLFGHAVALRIAQEDHLEEEDLVLPIIRERLSAAQQCEIVQRLLRDPQAADPTWVVTWLRHALTETERHAVAAVTTRLASTSSATVAPVPAG